MLKKLYEKRPMERVIPLFALFLVLYAAMFMISYLTHGDAWPGVPAAGAAEVSKDPIRLIADSGTVVLFIVGGNILVRAGALTPGLAIFLLQAATGGWFGGMNGGPEFFQGIGSYSAGFLKTGFLEYLSYAMFCAGSLALSIKVSDKFPPKGWTVQKKLIDLTFTKDETNVLIAALVVLAASGFAEALL
ncbi:hypothetical protein [Youngiibacter fragilis]|uniref:Uncharacterized protein n=1 Tax=Youngiibacter fragilis 232.1 TaxID=994573 RepID=V7I6W2_9CLOT|nr:hypothetical protein [Youngiibacter fragilis]ETA81036.1 hypothetical protein T472_0208725 [Youngiibacter fragilis 232.1]